MTTRLSILVLAAAVAPALACALRTSRPAAAPPSAAPAAPGASGAAQKPRAAEQANRAPTPPRQSGAGKFSDLHAGLEGASSQDCLGCHADTWPVVQAHKSHPIDVDYAAVAEKRSDDFTPIAAVLAGGIAVPDGKIACLTCHSLASPWKYHLAMPAGATPRPAVRLGDPSTYEEGSTSPPQPGSEVSPKPLCRACHAY